MSLVGNILTLLRSIASGLRSLFRKERVEKELDEELNGFLEMAIEEKMKQGLGRKEALRAVRLERGGLDATKEEVRSARWESFLEACWQDLRFAVRMLRKNPGSTAAVVVALALGIGMNTTVFSFANALLFRPPVGVEAPNQLLEIWLHNRQSSGIEGYLPLTYPDYTYYRDHGQSFEGMLAFDGDPHSVVWNRSGEGEIVQGQLVSGNFFSLLGVNAVLGRTISAGDDQASNPQPVVVLGHSFWQQHLGSDPGIIDKNLILNGSNYTVIGVAPPGFAGLLAGIEPDFWAPITMVEQIIRDKGRLSNRNGYWLLVAGRLKPGANARTAAAEALVLAHQIEQDHPDTNKNLDAITYPTTLVPAPYRIYVRAFAGLLLGVFALVLLIACANAASLLLARMTARAREMTVRSVLGASRVRLIRQMLIESTLLSGLAGGAGLILAYWCAPFLLALKPASLPITLRTPIDWRVFLFATSLALITGVTFGLTPALRSAKVQAAPVLKDETQSAGRRKSRLRTFIMIGEVAVCVVLLVGASLCVKSLMNASSIDPGFDTQHVAVATLDPGSMGYSEPQRRAFYEQLTQHIRALPGVSSASFVNHLPMGPAREQTTVTAGAPSDEPLQGAVPVDVFRIAPGYFQTMGILLLRGRDFGVSESDEPAGVAIINEALARRLWPGADPVGQRITSGGDKSATEIIGVVKTGKYRTLGEDPIPVAYLATLPPRRTLVLRTSGDPKFLLDAIRREIQTVDRNMAATDLETMQQYMSLPLFPARTVGLLLGASGVLALVLTCVGLFGVISYIVSQRTHEIGIRVALGARRGDVLRLVLKQGLSVTAIGLALGLGVALVAARLLSSLLYGIGPNDPATLIGVSVALTVVALLACYLPARRATRVDPMVALRYE